MDVKNRVLKIITLLKKEYPALKCALHYVSPFELLAATILSAQSTDVQVNKLTPALFAKYRTIEDYAAAPIADLERAVGSVNFYRNKAKNIQGAAKKIIAEFRGEVPRTMEEMISLPGVARKTANIVLSEAYGVVEGIAVDTHVRRLAGRLGLSVQEDPVKIERDLMLIVPRKDWAVFSHMLISHGRAVCVARAPRHSGCVLYAVCP